MSASRTSLVALVLAAASVAAPSALAAPQPTRPWYPPLSTCKKAVRSQVLHHGTLTIGTNSPALEPWFVDDDPGNGKGFESALAYKVAGELGFKPAGVTWVTEPFELAETAGQKPFDFDVNEAVYEPSLTDDVSFSVGYFNVNESLVALRGSKVVTKHGKTQLRHDVFGGVAGTPAIAFIRSKIEPVTPPVTYATLADAVSALKARKIAAIVIDTPTGHYLVSQQVVGAVQVGQFHTTGQYYALVLPKGSPMLGCIDRALYSLKHNGTVAGLSKQYLQVYNTIRFLQP